MWIAGFLEGGNGRRPLAKLKLIARRADRVYKLGSVALFVGKRAVEKAAAWKSPKAGLSHSAWKSRESGWISTFPTAPVTAAFNFLDSESKGIAELQRARLVCCFSQQKTDRPGDQLFNYRLRPF